MFASGEKSRAICDICGFEYAHNDLKTQTRNLQQTSLKVCRTCLDKDFLYFDPQTVYPDPTALPFTRVELGLHQSREWATWSPVGAYGVNVQCGSVTVTTD